MTDTARNARPGKVEAALWIALGAELIFAIVSLVRLTSPTDAPGATVSLIACLLLVAATLPPAAILAGMRELDRR